MDATIKEDLTQYEANLGVVVLSGVVSRRTDGLAASLIAYYARHIEKEIAAKKAATSVFFGTVGKREVFELTVQSIIDINGDFGVSHLHTFVDAAGNVAKWFSSNKRLEPGKTYKLKASVKKHDEFRGVKQTVLTRCTEV